MGWSGGRAVAQMQAPSHATLNSRPLYLQLRDLIVSRIADQHWKVGQALPNEIMLSKEFRVSVGTVRKAMDELSTEGLVRRQQGRGTFIADRHTAAVHGMFDRLRRSDGGFIDWSVPEIAVTFGRADDMERAALDLPEDGAEVIRFKRLRSANGRRLVLERAAVPAGRFAGRRDLLSQCADITPLASAFRIMLGRADVRLSAALARGEIASDLGLAPETPVQKVDRVVFDIDGTPIESCRSWLALVDEYYACTHGMPHESNS